MTDLSFGPRLLALPGPTAVPETVLQAMNRQVIDIYDGELERITDTLREDLKALFHAPNGRAYIYVANGHGGWEAALSNTLSRGDTVLVLDAGRFAVGWGEMGAAMGLKVETLRGRERGAVDPDAVEQRLAQDDGRIKAVLVAQIDTASGAVSDIAAIRVAIDAAGHEALYMVDGVASIGCMPFRMEAWGVDLAMTGSQKGLMTPPGLAPLVAGPRALEAHKTADLRTKYWDWAEREGPLHYQKYCGTPPEHLLFGLRRALDLLLKEEGLEASWARHAALASAVRAAIERWAEGGALEFNILDPRARCDTVTPVRLGEGCDGAVIKTLADQRFGVSLGTPIGEFKGPGGAFRIAHMGHASGGSIMGVLGATEAAMRALRVPLGDGALAAAATVLAEAVTPVG
ncbi:MAG: aminotransferase class V-fold PLP-dependent enzyme [Pseudomonadota bacterium]